MFKTSYINQSIDDLMVDILIGIHSSGMVPQSLRCSGARHEVLCLGKITLHNVIYTYLSHLMYTHQKKQTQHRP